MARRAWPRRLLAAVLAAAGLHAAAQPTPPPLPPALGPGTRWAPVLQEVEALIRTRAEHVPAFVPRHATPERIAELLALPEARALPRPWRENALILGGLGGPLMRFERPSDVLARVQAWFPDELQAARRAGDRGLRGHLHLWGPFEHWQPEAVAFMTMWNCMPQVAWLRPDGDGYARRLGEHLLDYPLAARQSSAEEADFGHCVRQRSGLRSAMSDEQHRRNVQAVHQMAAIAEPLLRERFAATLQRDGCTRSGPDDCVRVLQLWAELAPHDAALAEALRRLEPAVAPDGPLPPHASRSPAWDDQLLDAGRPRHDAAMRRAAFLRAKLAAQVAAPGAWAPDALPGTLQQLSRLRRDLATPYVQRWVHYELEYRNEPFNPWAVVRARAAELEPALLDELDRLLDALGPAAATPDDCAVIGPWLRAMPEAGRTAHLLRRLRRPQPEGLRCGAPEYDWLRQQARTEHRGLLYGLLALRPSLPPPLRDGVADGLTGHRAHCPRRGRGDEPGWLATLCAAHRDGGARRRDR